MNKIEKYFENFWKVKSLSKRFNTKDKKKYYEFFLDGYGCAVVDFEGDKLDKIIHKSITDEPKESKGYKKAKKGLRKLKGINPRGMTY